MAGPRIPRSRGFAITFRHELPYASIFGVGGALSIMFGIVLMITPGAGALVITWLIGWYAILFAAILFAYAWELHDIQREFCRGETGSTRAVHT